MDGRPIRLIGLPHLQGPAPVAGIALSVKDLPEEEPTAENLLEWARDQAWRQYKIGWRGGFDMTLFSFNHAAPLRPAPRQTLQTALKYSAEQRELEDAHDKLLEGSPEAQARLNDLLDKLLSPYSQLAAQVEAPGQDYMAKVVQLYKLQNPKEPEPETFTVQIMKAADCNLEDAEHGRVTTVERSYPVTHSWWDTLNELQYAIQRVGQNACTVGAKSHGPWKYRMGGLPEFHASHAYAVKNEADYRALVRNLRTRKGTKAVLYQESLVNFARTLLHKDEQRLSIEDQLLSWQNPDNNRDQPHNEPITWEGLRNFIHFRADMGEGPMVTRDDGSRFWPSRLQEGVCISRQQSSLSKQQILVQDQRGAYHKHRELQSPGQQPQDSPMRLGPSTRFLSYRPTPEPSTPRRSTSPPRLSHVPASSPRSIAQEWKQREQRKLPAGRMRGRAPKGEATSGRSFETEDDKGPTRDLRRSKRTCRAPGKYPR